MGILDARGLACPEPVLITKQEIEKVGCGSLQVLVNSGAAKDNITYMAQNLGWQVSVTKEDDDILLTLQK